MFNNLNDLQNNLRKRRGEKPKQATKPISQKIEGINTPGVTPAKPAGGPERMYGGWTDRFNK